MKMDGKILLVDDDTTLLDFYKNSFKFNFEMLTACDGNEGIKILNANLLNPFHVIVSDYDMPGINGIDFLIRAREVMPDSVRIMLTSASDIQVAINAISEGNIFRFLNKPCPPNTLAKNIVAGIDQNRLITAEKTLLEKTLLGSVGVIMEILSVVNPEAFAQTLRLRNLAKKMITRLKIENGWEIEVGVLLSQIGCVSIPPDIITKHFHGRYLSEQETMMFYSHPLSGYKFISKIPRLENIAEGIKNQFRDYSEGDNKSFLLSHFIKVLIDYDMHIHSGKLPTTACDIMNLNKDKYNPLVLQALEAEILQVMEGFVVKTISLENLQVRMVLADDIRSDRNVILVRKDSEISDVSLDKILNYRHFEPIQEPIKVLELIS
jgi:DNA-binding response OmpR family regulator